MYIDFAEAKRNINRQGTKILHDLASAYERGDFEDPNTSALFCSLLACICEGKVEGVFDEHSGEVKWSLTSEYEKEVKAIQAAIMESGVASGKVIRGPWE